MDIVGNHPKIKNATGPTVVTCVNNTLGVFPDAIKPRTYAQVIVVEACRPVVCPSLTRFAVVFGGGGGRGR